MLKREELTSERIDQIVADAHAAGYHFFLSSEAREASLKKTLTRYQPGEEVWVFAYGSLMWNPAIEFTEATPCAIEGWRRSFCFWVPLGRGTPELPGLMLALEEGVITRNVGEALCFCDRDNDCYAQSGYVACTPPVADAGTDATVDADRAARIEASQAGK